MKHQRRGENTIWVDTGESHIRSSMGALINCLVGKMGRMFGCSPDGKGDRIIGKSGVEIERRVKGGFIK